MKKYTDEVLSRLDELIKQVKLTNAIIATQVFDLHTRLCYFAEDYYDPLVSDPKGPKQRSITPQVVLQIAEDIKHED